MLLEPGEIHGKRTGRNRANFSGELFSIPLYIAAGHRYLPSPFSSFLMDREGFSGLRDVPHRREEDSLFLRPLPMTWTPGIFFLKENRRTPGYFIASPDRTLFLAYDPSGKRGAFALQSGDPDRPFSFFSDITGTKQDAEGRALARWESTDGLYSVRFAGERRAGWDNSQENPSSASGHRRGKSGLGYLRTGYRSRFFAEGGGMDRGESGMRLGGMELRYAFPSGFYLGGRGRSYRFCHYGSESPCMRDSGGAGGMGYESGPVHSALFFESREKGPRSGEFWIDYSGKGRTVSIGVGAIWSAGVLREGEFLFFHGPADRDSGIQFLQTGRGGAVLRIKNRYLYFYASTSFNRDADDLYLSLQAILPFSIGEDQANSNRDKKPGADHGVMERHETKEP